MSLDEDSDSDFDGYLDETDEMYWRGCGGNVDGGHKSMDNGGNSAVATVATVAMVMVTVATVMVTAARVTMDI